MQNCFVIFSLFVVGLSLCRNETSNAASSKELVIYFTRVGETYFPSGKKYVTKGNTEYIAEYIAKYRNAELFRIEEAEDAYPEVYDDAIALARKLKDENKRPKVKRIPEISQYCRIFIGHPIFYSDMPMHMFTALEALDFSGKEVYHFVTHEGSGYGSSSSSLKTICAKASSVTDGYSVLGNQAESSEESVKTWASSLSTPTPTPSPSPSSEQEDAQTKKEEKKEEEKKTEEEKGEGEDRARGEGGSGSSERRGSSQGEQRRLGWYIYLAIGLGTVFVVGLVCALVLVCVLRRKRVAAKTPTPSSEQQMDILVKDA